MHDYSRIQMTCFSLVVACISGTATAEGDSSAVMSLSGDGWRLATDPQNVGRDQRWFGAPRPEAKSTRVPWIIQGPFPGYHGVAWYWRDFTAPANPHADGRYWLRCWQVDYAADVWLNGQAIGRHEGGESAFRFDVTAQIKPGENNRLAIRVLNPTHTPIDGIVLNETAHRNKALPYSPGSAWDQGGIMDDVELLLTPPVRVADVYARPDWKTGDVRIEATLHNAGAPATGRVEFSIAPAPEGATLTAHAMTQALATGDTVVTTTLHVEQHRLWELKTPNLYRLTVRAQREGSASFDAYSVRFGFRDFRIADGWFRLNGRRIWLRCSHTGNCCPIGLELPHDPDYLRRDLVNAKFMGFNMIRFISGMAKRYQLDLCDELGLMVYEEAYAGWCMGYSAQFPQRYAESILGMVRRDRNHPSVTIFGLLNETSDGPVFQYAAGFLPQVRALDDTRLILLNSGRWNASGSPTGIASWSDAERADPCVTYNTTQRPVRALGITWAPGQLAFHPGRNGEYAAVRFTAPADDTLDLKATFTSIAEHATTDVHVLHNGQALYDGSIHVNGAGREQQYHASVPVKAGAIIDCVCGFGNGDYGGDTTAVALVLKSATGHTYAAAADFSIQGNPNGPWSYGWLSAGASPQVNSFRPFTTGRLHKPPGAASNPGSGEWQDILEDQHPYQRVPHSGGVIRTLRTMDGAGLPLFISEYGIGSACDLPRLVRLYEQAGQPDAEDAQLYRGYRDQFLNDWEGWKLTEAFARPEDFFAASNARMAGQRLLGLNAIRANPAVIGYSLTGTLDQGMTGEGLWTTFRELKPGTADAMFDGFAPLRWCLFADPVNVYQRTPVRLEAVLANEDVLAPGEYPVKLEVVGPGLERVFTKTVTVTIPNRADGQEPPMVLPVFADDVAIDGPAGRYRFSATFQRGAAAAGETIEFYVDDSATMPAVETEITLWGEDAKTAQWLADHQIRTKVYAATSSGQREVILAGAKPPSGDARAAFRELAQRVATGSTVVFLSPSVFGDGANPTAWLPLKNKGGLAVLPSWLYHKEDWCKRHPIFAGLPAPGLMDYTFYRELIPDSAFVGLDPPAEAVAGGINASCGYSAGLHVAVYPLGNGRFVLNTLNIREQLGKHPSAERLLRNLLRYAAANRREPPTAFPTDFDSQLKAMGY